MLKRCRSCGDKLIQRTGPGRNRLYCSIPCRRKQERTRARLRRVLKRLEARKERYATPGNAWGKHQLPYLLPKLKAAALALRAA